jgi:uncharacterized protein YecT (DUF1311 family)
MLRYLAGLAITLCAPCAVAAPSFDCKTAESARELAVCRDKRLAAADWALDKAYRAASTHAVAATREALKHDQEEFLNAIDFGFAASIWWKSEPSSEQMRKDIWALKRGGKKDPLADLEAQLNERVLFLRSLSAPDGFAGLWKNFDTELLIIPEGDRFLVTYGTYTYGNWSKYDCNYTAKFILDGQILRAKRIHVTGPWIKEEVDSHLVIRKAGHVLELKYGSESPEPVCVRNTTPSAPLFHTKLEPENALRLKPKAI